jgi:hypothetical protein
MKSYLKWTGMSLLAVLPALSAAAQTQPGPREGEVSLIGCVEFERDYKARKESGRAGGGVGVGNEFVLSSAKPVSRRGQAASAGVAAGDYNISGKLEKDMLRYVGRQIEVIGVIENAGAPMATVNVTLWHPVGDYCPAK